MNKENPQYRSVSLNGLKFTDGQGIVCETQSHYGLYVEGKGFVSFVDDDKKELVKLPYANTKKVIEDIISAGGLVNFSNVEFINPMQ